MGDDSGGTRNEVGPVDGGTVVQAGVIHGGVRVAAPGWRRPVVASTALVGLLGAAAVWWARPPEAPPPPPAALDVSARVDSHCALRLVGDGRPAGVPLAFTDTAVIHLTAQNRSEEEVLILAVRIVVQRREPPPKAGRLVREPCAPSPLPVRNFVVDLDADPPPVRPEPAAAKPLPSGAAPAPEVAAFPFKVSRNDPEVFRLGFTAETCDCTFTTVVDWVSGGETHEAAVGPHRIVPMVDALIRRE
ncbi:hypothetical protein [Actinokineospora iranica]|uniref:Uncharacterized protein n=1 Tax=Actinokineospora iranica TaxID=1271860 RepID=A0A1G6XN42_9PSEU|nr:hypothetical protein [Actinokineospora iranica]SDD78757.1 hypothetical protein SAMN05216174_1186 [Actinokineospora iranica]